MRCPNSNYQIKPQKNCPICGTKLDPPVEKYRAKPLEIIKVFIVCLYVIFLIVALFYIPYSIRL